MSVGWSSSSHAPLNIVHSVHYISGRNNANMSWIFKKKSLLEYPGNLLEICSVKSVDTLNKVFHPYNTHTKDSLHYEIYRSTLGQRSIRYKGSLPWNSHSDELKDIVGTSTFINKLKELLINK